MNSLALKKFSSYVSLNGVGELNVNAGIYSRTAIIMAFELNGGIEQFAVWAKENESEFYTKMSPNGSHGSNVKRKSSRP